MKFWMRFCFVWVLALFLFACNSGGAEEVSTPVATAAVEEEVAAVTDTPEPEPTDTAEPEPTDTPEPTNTPEPTDTPEPTAVPTDTPEPEPTDEPEPTATQSRPTLTPTPDKSRPEATPTPEETTATGAGNDDPETADALQLIIQAEERAQRLETITINQLIIVSVPGLFEQKIDQTCATQLPTDAYCTMIVTVTFEGGDPVETIVETVTLGEQSWLREEGGEWEELPPDMLEQQGFSQEGLEQLKISEFILEAEQTGETIIDGVPVYEISFTLDVNNYFASILGEEAAELFTQGAEENSGSGRMWIGQEDMLSRKVTVEMTFVIEGESLTVTTQAASSGHDEPVEIPDPTGD
jgi:hypothetical protein